jgi:hypothetical protein
VPFRDTRAAGAAHDDIGSNTNMPVARAAVPAARPYRGSSLHLLMVQKGIIIHDGRDSEKEIMMPPMPQHIDHIRDFPKPVGHASGDSRVSSSN